MKTRNIRQYYAAPWAQVGNDRVRRAFPVQGGLDQVSPFIFLDHLGPKELAPGDMFYVPPHPHAGFQTVTYQLSGRGFHKDSLGNEQVIEPGAVNWMTAGKGIVHSERVDPSFSETGGTMHFAQIWVNLPAKDKYTDPHFGAYPEAELPKMPLPHGGYVRVVAGKLGEYTSPVHTFSPLFLFHAHLEAGERVEIPIDATHQAAAYVLQGDVTVGEATADSGTLLSFDAKGEGVALENSGQESADVLVFGGEPIEEPMVAYGPFVMNDHRQIQQAILDYESGKMGILES